MIPISIHYTSAFCCSSANGMLNSKGVSGYHESQNVDTLNELNGWYIY